MKCALYTPQLGYIYIWPLYKFVNQVERWMMDLRGISLFISSTFCVYDRLLIEAQTWSSERGRSERRRRRKQRGEGKVLLFFRVINWNWNVISFVVDKCVPQYARRMLVSPHGTCTFFVASPSPEPKNFLTFAQQEDNTSCEWNKRSRRCQINIGRVINIFARASNMFHISHENCLHSWRWFRFCFMLATTFRPRPSLARKCCVFSSSHTRYRPTDLPVIHP